jgi:CheY-like chemotaxis protein
MHASVPIATPLRGGIRHPADGMTADQRPAPTRPPSAHRLLVVEDNQIIREALGAGLELHGYEVATASSGLGALAEIARMVPDLIVLDLEMPGMSGARFVESLTLSELRSGVRIVVVVCGA